VFVALLCEGFYAGAFFWHALSLFFSSPTYACVYVMLSCMRLLFLMSVLKKGNGGVFGVGGSCFLPVMTVLFGIPCRFFVRVVPEGGSEN